MWPGRHSTVSLTDRSPGMWHDKCPAVSRPQLPPSNDRRNGVHSAHVSQVRRHQTAKALEGDHSRDRLT